MSNAAVTPHFPNGTRVALDSQTGTVVKRHKCGYLYLVKFDPSLFKLAGKTLYVNRGDLSEVLLSERLNEETK